MYLGIAIMSSSYSFTFWFSLFLVWLYYWLIDLFTFRYKQYRRYMKNHGGDRMTFDDS